VRKLETLAHNIFPLMALSGLLLAGWALIATPANLKNGSEAAAVRASAAPADLLDQAAEAPAAH
jgi:hypothetical protein